MALSVSRLLTKNPEFEAAGAQLIAAKIEEAQSRLSADAFGSNYDLAVEYLACHLLWTSPFGASMRLDGGDRATSEYETKLQALSLERVPRIIVL